MSLVHGGFLPREGLVCHFDAANIKSYRGGTMEWRDTVTGSLANLQSNTSFSPDVKGAFYNSSTVLNLSPADYGLDLRDETVICFAKCETPRSSVGGGGFSNRIIQWGGYYANNSGGFGLQSGGSMMYLKGSTSSGWSRSSSSGAANTIYDQYDYVLYTLRFIGNDRIVVTMNGVECYNTTIGDGYTGYTNNTLAFGTGMNMSLAMVMLYNRVLGDGEMATIFNTFKRRFFR